MASIKYYYVIYTRRGFLKLKNTTIITVGSVTVALRARKLLQKNGIKSKVVKVDATKSEYGCTHGIEFLTKDFYAVAMQLRKEELVYKIYSE